MFRSTWLTPLDLLVLLPLALILGAPNATVAEPWDGYQIAHNTRVTNGVYNVYALSAQGCLRECSLKGSCNSVSFRSWSYTCTMSPSFFEDLATTSVDDNDWMTYGVKEPWTLVFQGIPDIGTSMYHAWMTGASTTSHDVNCMGIDVTSCPNHYRSSLVNSWSALNVKRVKLSIYDNGREEATMTFNATGADLESWFEPQRVLTSFWNVAGVSSFNHFSLVGDMTRRFYMNAFYNSCTNDPTMLAVFEGFDTCAYTSHASYPKIVYSTSPDWMEPTLVDGSNYADSLGISIQYAGGP